MVEGMGTVSTFFCPKNDFPMNTPIPRSKIEVMILIKDDFLFIA
jgi:hypothetical protein